MDNNNNDTFSYTYSAKEQSEIQDIRKKYLSESQEPIDKMEQLRRLDASVTKKGTVVSLILGIIGSLILGVGMCCTMVWSSSMLIFTLGVIIGLIGIVLVALAYPAYASITKKERDKIAPQIIKLTDELLK